MKIKNVTLCNFRNYKGENKIDMISNNDNHNNITLIGGFNGSGKTTIVDSIKLCIFGKIFNGSPLSNENYINYLNLAKNKSSIKNKDNSYFTQVEIEMDDSFPSYNLTLRREWESKNGKIDKENFTVYQDGVPLEIIPRDYWEDYIISLIPPYVSDYFFFDGERVKELATGNKAEEILKESIRDLIGLKPYETLANDLNKLMSKIKRRNIKQTGLQKKIDDKEGALSEINKNLGKIEKNINTKSNEIKILNTDKQKLENELTRKAGAYAKERKKLESEILTLKEELNELNNGIKQICSDFLPFIIASKTCKELLEQLEKEKKLKELIASEHVVKEIKKSLLRKISLNKKLNQMSKNELEIIKNSIKNIFVGMLIGINNNSEESLIHDLPNTEMARIEDIIKKNEKNVKPELNESLKLRETNLITTKKLQEKLRNVPGDSFVKEYIDTLASIRSKIEGIEKDIASFSNERSSFWEKRSDVEIEIKELEEKIVCIEEDNRKIDLCMKIRNSIQVYNDTIITSKLENLSKIITEMYRKLANKNDMVKEIKIDPNTFSTTLIDFDGGIVDKDNISAGEKEIYALSVLWGLAQISNKKFPVIIDSPLAKLDNSHVDKIINNFFPNAGDQVILLSHDREIDSKLYKKLKPHLNKAYHLSMSEENKIQNGYFFN